MAQYINSQISGWFKEVFANTELALAANNQFLVKNTPFLKNKKLGDTYEVPVIPNLDDGFTHIIRSDGLASLQDGAAAAVVRASVSAPSIVQRVQIGYSELQRASNGSQASFGDGYKFLMKRMSEAMAHRVELCMWYGGTSLATASSSTNSDATTTVVTMDKATWAAAIWKSAIGSRWEAYQTDSLSTQVGSAEFTVSAVNPLTRAVTVTGASGDITALDSRLSSNSASFVPLGSVGRMGTGLHDISGNTGTLFGVSGATYPVWQGNTVDVGSAPLTSAKIGEGVVQAINKGLAQEDVALLCSPETFNDLNEQVRANFRYSNSDFKKVYHGAMQLCFPCGGVLVHVIASPYCKRGFAYLGPFEKIIKRIGAAEIEFGLPGSNQRGLTEISDKAGVELRGYTEQTPFCEHPGGCVRLYNIVDSAS